MNKVFLLLISMITIVSASPMRSERSPEFWLDINQFDRESNYRVEIYYSISFNELSFKKIQDQNITSITTSLTVRNADDEIVFEKNISRKAKAVSEAEMQDEKRVLLTR